MGISKDMHASTCFLMVERRTDHTVGATNTRLTLNSHARLTRTARIFRTAHLTRATTLGHPR